MRVLGRIRLSRLTEESTSAARQREVIQQWADTHGHELIGWAEDLDISGSVDPFDTPSLGPWLRPDREGEWDTLCVSKLDRLGRNSIKLNKLFGWAVEHGKTVVSCSEGIDLGTPVGRLIANVIAFLAEGELEAIRERTKASRRKLLESGRWAGGNPQFGYKAVQMPGGGWRLEPDLDQVAVLKQMIADVIAGTPIIGVSEKYGMPPSTLWQILESKQLLGHATFEKQTVRDSQGKPVFNGEPLLTPVEWDRLQEALVARRQGPKRSKNTSPLLGVVKCFVCDDNLLHKIYHRDYGKRLYRYYHCRVPGHCAQVDAEMVEEMLEEVFLDAVGNSPVMEKVFIPAENHQIELDEARRAVDELLPLLGMVTSDSMRSRLTEQMRALDFRITSLEKLPVREAGYKYIETDTTYHQRWKDEETEGRRQLLLKSGIRFRVKRTPGTQAIQSELYVPEEILDLLNAKKPPSP
jgi:DNA invertase Pin-like site-specific DNA recombinase